MSMKLRCSAMILAVAEWRIELPDEHDSPADGHAVDVRCLDGDRTLIVHADDEEGNPFLDQNDGLKERERKHSSANDFLDDEHNHYLRSLSVEDSIAVEETAFCLETPIPLEGFTAHKRG
jgi:hypothetical protein